MRFVGWLQIGLYRQFATVLSLCYGENPAKTSFDLKRSSIFINQRGSPTYCLRLLSRYSVDEVGSLRYDLKKFFPLVRGSLAGLWINKNYFYFISLIGLIKSRLFFNQIYSKSAFEKRLAIFSNLVVT